MKTQITRREMIQRTLAGFGALSIPVALSGCSNNSDDGSQPDSVRAEFLHGVASGDPQQDRVILWTRLTPSDTSVNLRVAWEIAADEQFTQSVNSGLVETGVNDDFTVKIDADRLKAGQTYYYRFKYGNQTSPVGRTRSLPQTAALVRFAVCSCSNYPAGYFHVYREMAKLDVDAIIHLGDYIYEYGNGEYATDDARELGRLLPEDNAGEIIQLDDYRKRYALYRTDKDLQSAHQQHPFIVVWDDHELANDAWNNGAENHQENEGDFSQRKMDALKAYFEWMPIRPVSVTERLTIYRQFNYGDLVQLLMLDTRIIARDKQLDYADYLGPAGMDMVRFRQDLLDTGRTIMGHAQHSWLRDGLMQSRATWNVLGQQVLMTKMMVPAELLPSLAAIMAGQATPELLLKLNAQIKELVTLKVRMQMGDPGVTESDKARLSLTVPYNLDAWDGYFAEREAVYQVLKQSGKKVVVLAGDTHNAWSSELKSVDGYTAGVEFATSSVSSPGLEQYLNIPQAQLQEFEFAFTTLIDELNYCNLNQRGFLKVSFSKDQVQSDWIYVSTIKDKSYVLDVERAYSLTLDTQLKKPVSRST